MCRVCRAWSPGAWGSPAPGSLTMEGGARNAQGSPCPVRDSAPPAMRSAPCCLLCSVLCPSTRKPALESLILSLTTQTVGV